MVQPALNRPAFAGAAIILVITLTAVGSYQKLRDLDRSDSALYAYGGFVLEQGGRLYRDLWDHKPPGVYAVDAIAFWLARGPSWSAVVAADTLATLLAIVACVAIVHRLRGGWLAPGLAAVAAAFYLNLAAFHRGGGLAEIHMTALLAWAGWAFLASRTSTRWQGLLLALSGCLAGLAILCKPTALTTVAACLLALTIETLRRREVVALLRQTLLYVACLAAPLLLAGLIFLQQGSLGDMVDASLLYNLSYVRHGVTLRKLWTFHLQHNLFLLAGGAVVLGAALLRPARRPDRFGAWVGLRFLAIWLAFEWLGMYAGNYNNGQYLLSGAIALSCLAGIGASYLLRSAWFSSEWQVRSAAGACLLLALVLAYLPARDQWRQILRAGRGTASAVAVDQIRVADLIRATSQPDDRIWVWGYAPQVYLAAQRPPATRFVFDGAFLNSRRVMRHQFHEMLADLDRNRPLYIVDAATTGWFAVWLQGPLPGDLPSQPAQYREELRQLQAWVAEHYVATEEYGELIVYRRRAQGPQSGQAFGVVLAPAGLSAPQSRTDE